MRKMILIAFASVFVLTACNTANSKAEEATDTKTSEKVVAKGKPIHVSKAEFLTKISNYEANPNEWKYIGDKPCIIDFWATWCPPCRAIAPKLDELAKEYENDIYIYKVDVDKESELATKFNIQSIPTLLFVPMEGKPQAEVGNLPKEQLKNKIDNFLLKK